MRFQRSLFLRLTTPADFAIVALATTAEKACTLTLAHFRHFSSLRIEYDKKSSAIKNSNFITKRLYTQNNLGSCISKDTQDKTDQDCKPRPYAFVFHIIADNSVKSEAGVEKD